MLRLLLLPAAQVDPDARLSMGLATRLHLTLLSTLVLPDVWVLVPLVLSVLSVLSQSCCCKGVELSW